MNDTGVRVPNGFDSFGPWFSETFELLKAQWQNWVLISLIYLAIACGSSFLISTVLGPFGGVAGLVVSALLMPGMIQAAIKQIRGQAFAPGDIFSATGFFLGALIVILAMSVGVIACGIGVLVTTTLFFLALPLLVDRGTPFDDAIKQSLDVTKQNFWFFLVYMLVISIISSLGSIACGIGIILTFPFSVIGMAVAYERTFNGPAAIAEPEAAPEPPTTPPAE